MPLPPTHFNKSLPNPGTITFQADRAKERHAPAVITPLRFSPRLERQTPLNVHPMLQGHPTCETLDERPHASRASPKINVTRTLTRASQGFLSLGNGNNHRLDAVLAEFERKNTQCGRHSPLRNRPRTTLVNYHRLPYPNRLGGDSAQP